MNLNYFVDNQFTDKASFDFESFSKYVKLAVRAMDNVVEMNLKRQPLTENYMATMNGRRIGLGFTGLADTFVRMGLVYGSDESIALADKISACLKLNSIEASIDLAQERGEFRLLSTHRENNTKEFNEFINHPYYSVLSDEYKEKMAKYGIRNVGLNTVAPNGSISIILKTSSGIEPIFRTEYERTVQQGGEPKKFVTYHPLVLEYNKKFGEGAHKKTDLFISANDIDWKNRIKMQSAIQRNLSQSISSTVNLPKDTTSETISSLYIEAWKAGLKGITVYVDKSRDGVMNEKSDDTKTANEVSLEILEDVSFPKEGDAKYKVLTSEGRKWYVFYTLDEKKLPNSLFLTTNNPVKTILAEEVVDALGKLAHKKSKKVGKHFDDAMGKHPHLSNSSRIMRAFGTLLRHRVPILEICNAVDTINPPIYSLVFQVKKMLLGLLDGVSTGKACPDCGSKTGLVYENGCVICKQCGGSRCG